MAVTRDTLVLQTRAFMDATGSDRWSDTNEILPVLDTVYDGEWSSILGAAPYYRVATRTPTTDSSGRLTLTDLNSGSGDTAQLWHRIITLSDANSLYYETRFQDVPLLLTTSSSASRDDRQFYVFGAYLQLLPVAASSTFNVTVNYKPPALTDLASGTSTIDFPAGSHLILCWEAAAILLAKGGAETGPGQDLRGLATLSRSSMLADIQRRTVNPLRLMPPDSARDWAG